MESVILAKAEIIENRLHRIREAYIGFKAEFKVNYTKKDSIILNIQRAVQSCLDLAAYIVKEKMWGIPKSSRESFDILCENQFIPAGLGLTHKKIVGFRNIAVYEYKKLDLQIIESIILNSLKEIEELKTICLKNF